MNEFTYAKPTFIDQSINLLDDARNYYEQNGLEIDNPYFKNLLDTTPKTKQPTEQTPETYDLKSINQGIIYSTPEVTSKTEEAAYNEKIPISSRAKYTVDFFVKKGLPKHMAAAIAGNFNVESGFDSGNVGDKHLKTFSEGLGQWREKRLDNLKSFAKSKGKDYRDFNTQLEFT